MLLKACYLRVTKSKCHGVIFCIWVVYEVRYDMDYNDKLLGLTKFLTSTLDPALYQITLTEL